MTANLRTIVDRHHRGNVRDFVHLRNISWICCYINIDPLKVGVVLRQLGNNRLYGLAGTTRRRGEKIHRSHSILPCITLLVFQSLNGFSQ